IGDPGRLALGVSMVRRTDHNDLQQVSDEENSLALLFARQDYRDYFEREGFGGYAALRVPAWTTLSVHLRNDEYRALALDAGTRSFVHMGRDLRPNPAIDPGQAHTLSLRLDHRVHIRQRLRAGFYHWIAGAASSSRAGGTVPGSWARGAAGRTTSTRATSIASGSRPTAAWVWARRKTTCASASPRTCAGRARISW